MENVGQTACVLVSLESEFGMITFTVPHRDMSTWKEKSRQVLCFFVPRAQPGLSQVSMRCWSAWHETGAASPGHSITSNTHESKRVLGF